MMNFSTAVICVVIVAIGVFGIKSYVKKLASGCCGSGTDTVKKTRVADTDPAHFPYVKVLDIEGMHCKNCAARIENALNREGVCFARVSLGKGQATVYMKQQMPDADLRSIVSGLGYSVRANSRTD